ncbi:MAG: M20/M25/M40 family metallo-hydrolase [Chloroflexi bacterium]|nr:M20/M25/M40 family metallo-hydrolase [Chloroflexota bacterium]
MERTNAQPPRGRVLEIIDQDRQDLVDLCLELGNTPSPHAQERVVAEKVVGWLKTNGIESWLQPITEQSANAVGVLHGVEDGTSLICDAHLDVGPELSPTAPERIRRINQAWVEGELLYGYGVINCKGQLGAFMLAARALLKAGVRLKGDLTVAGVAFETGAPSVGDQQGINYPGEGFGTWWLFNRGVTADYALIGETSGFGLVTAECGELGLEIRARGRRVYTPRLERGPSWRDHPSSIVHMAHLVPALEAWATDYEQRERLECSAGTIVPKAQVEAIHGSPGLTSVHLDVRILPGANPRAIQHEIRNYLRGQGFECEVEAYQWSRGYIAQDAEPLIAAVTDAHLAVLQTPPPRPPTPELSMWRDLNMFNEVGIPSICYGPPRQKEYLSDAQDRAMKISDLVACTKVYALTALNLCGVAGS